MSNDAADLVHGTCDPRFEGVREAFVANFAQGLDVGASACVTVGGEVVVDLWGGHVDAEKTTPWAEDTITNVWSTTKTMTALTALYLADKGDLDFDAPVATYWPEFAANGKEGVLVRHLMSHTAGLPAWEGEQLVEADLWDWEKMTSRLAAQAPWWEPGTRSGYHALSQGYLVGEVIRRASGSTVGQLFAKEIAGPLGADFHIGLDPVHHHRVANVIPPVEQLFDVEAAAALDPTSVMARMGNPAVEASWSWTPEWRQAEIPAGGGHGNARSVALVQSIVSGRGEARGTRLLSSEGIDKIFEVQIDNVDLVMGGPLCHGIGYGLPSAAMPLGGGGQVCFWGGWGGSIVINDVTRGMTVAYMMNRMSGGTTGDSRGGAVAVAAYIALG